jgi:signal transduction histidine kinase
VNQNPLRTVGGRLSLALAFVVAGALLIAYLVVVPSLENRVIDARLDQLEGRAPDLVLDLERVVVAEEPLDLALTTHAQALSVRLIIYQVLNRNPLALRPVVDSSGVAISLNNDRIARGALSGESTRGTVRRGGDLYAEFATPFGRNAYLLISASLEDSLQNVELVERRILIAGLIALAIALSVGYVAARMFASRIKRLERAADRIASGRFDEPVVDTGKDELGELAQAFDRMRQRLANLDDARREFIANASHELRTPLFSLGGMLELLEDEDLDDATRDEFLRTMRQQVRRLTKLATDLLDLTRIDAGRLHVEREPVELALLAADLADEFRALAAARDHELTVDGGDAIALADDERVLQIGRILVENAIIHTPAGTSIRIAVAGENGNAVLEVSDEGPGIPAEHATHVFERFYRVDGALTSGSGLGLAIARELAELMGGEVALESRPGRTVFRLRLPAATQAEHEPVGAAR